MIVLVTVGRRPAAADDPVALPARRLRVPRRRRRSRPRSVADGVAPERAELLARLAGGRLDRARALDGRLGAGARRVRRRGRAPRRHRAARSRVAGRARAGRGAGRGRPSSRPRRPRRPSELDGRARGGRLPRPRRGGRSCDGSRSGTSARTAARAPTRCSKGITALETVYRDALAGPGAAPLNLDRAVLVARRRARAAAALDACRDARQALAEFNPNETPARSSGCSCTCLPRATVAMSVAGADAAPGTLAAAPE